MPLSIYRDQRQRDARLISPLQRDAGNSHVQVSNARMYSYERKIRENLIAAWIWMANKFPRFSNNVVVILISSCFNPIRSFTLFVP